jgi:hypothetical protein
LDNIYECVVITVDVVMVLRDFEPYGIFMNEYVVVTVPMIMMSRAFLACRILFMYVYVVINVATIMMLRDIGP